ncbi:MAG: carboxypeptidase regulatory-like domain-containing protein [Acidobacteriota bacterium]|nr:MAG: carboxypeptidase regulatory-like domain-containing protein [Acidobacteriota bacterium]
MLLVAGSSAQVGLTALAPSASIDFESTIEGVGSGTFEAVGFAPAPLAGQLDSDAWSVKGFSDGDLLFGGTAVSGDLARGTIAGGGTSTGGLYALADFPSAGGHSAAFQSGGTDFTPGSITLKITNLDPKQIIVSLTVSYDIYELNDQGRSTYLYFSYSGDDVSYTPLPMLDHTTVEAADASPEFFKIGKGGPSRTVTINPISVIPNGEFFLRWESDDFSGTGSRDELAIDNISIQAQFLGTTGAEGSIEGRVLSADGKPLGFVTVLLSGNGEEGARYALTSHFGRFRFDGLVVGNTYVIQAISGRDSFETPSIPVTLNGKSEFVTFRSVPVADPGPAVP